MANTQFVVNADRLDPYKNFLFRVKWDGKYVAGISKVGALIRKTTAVKHRDGGDSVTNRKTPGVWDFDPILLQRGVSHDAEFLKWAQKVWNTEGAASGTVSLKDFRKDIIIELLNEQGSVAKAYNVFNCWVSEYQALPELDASGTAVAIESIKLENEGWEFADTPEPKEVSNS
jgi:phage tail-like protein